MGATNGVSNDTEAVVPGLLEAIEKWLDLGLSSERHSMHRSGTSAYPTRCVRVEMPGRESSGAMYFFLQDDGNWGVFPQEDHGPAMSTRLFAA
ncbi:MAG TPA: hypothetical protein VHC91_06195 [Trinickia sp.]|uniref:hypothetical protein n=1 Tax=Trinickia sp. TaxID=2571163 RepID=UPI002BBE57E9|nr:hypothetical protein [Trinickia sp.]HVW49984.1 hypothetical protein [Trinickia sp.]